MSEQKIIPDNIVNWITELRSGVYQQTEGTLKREIDDGSSFAYCCLGVYLESVANVKVKAAPEDSQFPGADKHYNKCSNDIDAYVVSMGIQMNDDGRSFAEIADAIEEWYMKGREK